MPDNILDQVNFLVGADLGPYRSALRQAEAEAQASGAKIKAALGGGGGGGGAASNLFGDTAAGAQKLSQARAAVEGFGTSASAALTKAHVSTSTATREFRALFDELSSGRTRMAPGTLAIIATRVFGLSLGTLAWAAAIAAIPIAFGVAAVQAENALSRIQRALALTGNATGATVSQIRSMAAQISAGGIQSRGGAETGLSILAGRGNVGAAQLPGAETAASGLALLSGQKLDKAAEELEKALAQPAEGAKTLNEQMKLLSGAQTREIDDLVAAGEKEKAQQIIIDALNQRTADATSALGGFARALAEFGRNFANFWKDVGDKAAGIVDPAVALSRANTDVAGIQKALAGETHPERDTALQAQLRTAQTRQALFGGIVAGQGQQAAMGAQLAHDSDQVRDGLLRWKGGLSKGLARQEELSNATQDMAETVSAARRELQRAQAKGNAGEIAGAQRNLRDALDIQQHPLPPVRGARGPKPGVVDATSDQTVANAIKDELEGYLKLNQSLEARFAIQQAVNAIEDRAKDAALRKELAEKRITGAAAQQAVDAERRAQLLRNQADAQDYAWKLQDEQGKIDDEMTGFQVATLNAHERMATVGSDRLKIQLQLYDIETKQLQDAQAKEILRNPNIDLNTALGMAGGLAASRGAGRVALAGQPQTAADVQTQNLRETNTQLQLEIGLKYADAELRAKELADLQAAMQLKQEGWAIDDAGYANALAQRRTLLEANAQLNLTLQGQTKGAQTLGTIRQGLDNIAMAGLGGFTSLKQAASDFLLTLARMALQLYIMQPLLNGLFGTSGQPGGGLFGQILGALGIAPSAGSVGSTFNAIGGSFGGGHAAGGYTDPSKFYVVGENGPELFRPGGAGGNVIPLTAPRSSQVASGGYAAGGDINHNISIQVSGNSDQQLMERVHLAASQAVSQGIKAYDHVQGRTQRARFIQSNRRALS